MLIYSLPSLLHQIDLELRVCHGSSVKKALVNEAISYGAAQLIIGVMKNSPLGYVRHNFFTSIELWFSYRPVRLLQEGVTLFWFSSYD